ncbi:MAG TPA: hypothetical protein VNU95_03340 [Candidatus Acidoferrales bacterium]|jgi:hypothetical protein|nr:hypothetical protein [Candidatus Acidoferrales bacterium]
MQLRFSVNQAEAFRQGIDCPKSIVHVEVDPATLDGTTRRLIADRMKGIDVYQLEYRGNGETAIKLDYEPVTLSLSVPVRIEANAPTFEAMMEAVKENERELQESKSSLVMSNPADRQAARMSAKAAGQSAKPHATGARA